MQFKRINVLLYLCIGLMVVTLGLISADPVQAQGAKADRQKSPGMGGGMMPGGGFGGGMMPGGMPGMMPGAKADGAVPSAEKKPIIKRYKFKYTSLDPVMITLRALKLDQSRIKIGYDVRTHALIVVADSQGHSKIQEIIKMLDVPEEAPNSKEIIETYTFPDEKIMEKMIRSLLINGGEIISRTTNPAKVMVMGPSRTHEQFKNFLEQYNKQLTKKEQDAVPRRVRMVWLSASTEPQDKEYGYDPVPEDMKPVVKELEKIGLKNIEMVAQVVVHTASSNEFNLQSVPLFKGVPCKLGFTGKFNGQTRGLLHLDVSGYHDASNASTPNSLIHVVSLESTIKTRPGHPVVLAVSPNEGTTSIFVLITYDD